MNIVEILLIFIIINEIPCILIVLKQSFSPGTIEESMQSPKLKSPKLYHLLCSLFLPTLI